MKKQHATGKLKRRDHESAPAARVELLKHGYTLAFSPPGTPEKWKKRKNSSTPLTIQREERPRSTVWHITEYPNAHL